MAGWAGFSDEDLMQIKQTTSPASPSSKQMNSNATKQAMARKQKVLQQQRELARQRTMDFAQGQSHSTPLLSSQCLSSPPSTHLKSKEEPKVKAEIRGETKTPDHSSSTALISEKQEKDSDNMKSNEDGDKSEPDEGVKEMDEQEGLRVELSRMEQFRLQQQKMEEENKQRRRILADAIKQRSKMAKEEAEKLTKVQAELKRLDSLVNADVSIIRDKIEVVSMDFLQAQKRYERAEKEFVEAKMALAEKSDLKESLTEHLYTVIQQNEARKAERLAILMKELGMEAENCPITLVVPPLLSFSPINTLHRPQFPPAHPTTPVSPNAADEGGSDKPSADHVGKEAKEEAKSKDQVSDQCQNKDSPGDVDVTGGEQTDKADQSSGADTQVAEAEIPKEKSVDNKIQECDKGAEGEQLAAKVCAENGSPESQDGGPNTS